MSKLNLSVAIGDYDRNRPLIDGAVQIDGVDPVFMKLYPEEIFFRAFRAEEFDICECSLSSFSVKTAAGNNVAVGPILLGAAAPVHILTPSTTVRRIVNMTALTVTEANSARAD